VGVNQADVLLRPLIRLAGKWTFWADSIVSPFTPLGPLDVVKFTYSSKLNDYGTGAVTLALPSGLDPARMLQLWSYRIWALYDDGTGQGAIPCWCGVPTGCQDAGVATVDLTLTELPGYLAKRTSEWFPSKVYAQVDQMTIASDLAAAVADVGVTVAVGAASGIKRDRTYEYLQNNRGTLLTELAGVIQGPQFRTEYGIARGGNPSCTLRIAYPRVGADTGLGVTMPGLALGYGATWDSDQMRTRTYAVGDLPDNAAANTPKPVKMLDVPQANMPRLDAVDDWPGVVVQSTLNEKAATASQQQAPPGFVLTVTPSEAEPPVTFYDVGDTVTVWVTTPVLAGGLRMSGQLTQVDVDAAAGTAVWTVASSVPPPRVRYHLAKRLDRLDATTSAIFRSGPLTNI
jgi:hypothetical protein